VSRGSIKSSARTEICSFFYINVIKMHQGLNCEFTLNEIKKVGLVINVLININILTI
jgi:hypothetical protein